MARNGLAIIPIREAIHRIAVASVLEDGTESTLSSSGEILQTSWSIRGPFPHRVGESGRFEIDVPLELLGAVVIEAEILSLVGSRVRQLANDPLTPGRSVE
jgi:hypothetical protein